MIPFKSVIKSESKLQIGFLKSQVFLLNSSENDSLEQQEDCCYWKLYDFYVVIWREKLCFFGELQDECCWMKYSHD